MSHRSNLYRRGASGIWYARVFVPLDLQETLGKDEIRPSLRTTDLVEAKRRRDALLNQWGATFDDMRRRRTLTNDDIQTAVWDHYTSAVVADDAKRASKPTATEIDAAIDAAMAAARVPHPAGPGLFDSINSMTEVDILVGRSEWDFRRKATRLARLRADLGAGDARLIEPETEAFLKKHRFNVDKRDPRYRELCFKLMRADIERLERFVERERGDFGGAPRDPIVAEPAVRTDDALNDATHLVTIIGLFEKYERENPNDVRPETFKQARRDVQHFADFVGPRVRASKISKTMVRDWKYLLADYPVKAAETNAFKGMTLGDIVTTNKAMASPKPTLTRQTVRRYMASLGGFCRWLVRNDYLEANPVADMLPKKAGPTNERDTFTNDALKTLFGSPLFKTAKSGLWRDLDKPGHVAVRDHRFWIPWVMLYSGARPAEIAQLHVGDVRQEQNMWIMNISDEGGGNKRTKTVGSRRVVPIHTALIELGFLKHIEHQRTAGEVQVFPDVEIPKEGQIAAQFSREFNRYLAKVGVKTGRGTVTYSLRHTFVDRARLAGFMDDQIAAIVGHETGSSKKTMTSGYGVEQHGTLSHRRDIIEAVRYLTVSDIGGAQPLFGKVDLDKIGTSAHAFAAG